MKCSSCGAEIGNNKICEFCGSQITTEMQKEQEQLNKSGCPKCGSSNVKFTREKLGESKDKNSTKIVRVTTGMCNDCGYTWQTQDTPKKSELGFGCLDGFLFFLFRLQYCCYERKI